MGYIRAGIACVLEVLRLLVVRRERNTFVLMDLCRVSVVIFVAAVNSHFCVV